MLMEWNVRDNLIVKRLRDDGGVKIGRGGNVTVASRVLPPVEADE